MSFLYSLKRHVGKGRIYIVWDNSAAHAQNMCMSIEEGYTSNIFAEILA